ncbi:hypothetical protein H7J07_06765 [Mycobacterium koreense]|nr:hypothetical protein [Mycolicibacillus koreensis]MCV7247921.1 hypothetical protein [Mycolicibacillus koreensis]BBY56164.1 hypothetical protein MKOR_34150 [Mycolicibacillus koreensis]
MSKLTKAQRQEAELQEMWYRAAFETMRRNRRRIILWLVAATALSVIGNVGKAALTLPPGPTQWLGIGWAAVPPVLLMLAVEALPTLEQMQGAEQDRAVKTITWGIVAAAFGWSAHELYSFTVMVGVLPQLAVLAPVTIDLSILAATRGLVKTAPAWARMKAGVAATAPPTAAQPASVSAATRDGRSAITRRNAETATAKREPEPRIAAPTATANRDGTPRTADATATVPATATPELRDLAEQVHAARVARKLDADDIALILAADADGAALNRIASDHGVHRDVVAKVLGAARQLDHPDQSRALAAV